MALPTKMYLLALGLEPIEHEDCPICILPMKTPVRVPCNGKHAFCKACITTWLRQPGIATCPTCRQVLCTAPANDMGIHEPRDPTRFTTMAHRIRVDTACRASGLSAFVLPMEIGHPPFNRLLCFSKEIPLVFDDMMGIVSLARAMLTGTYTSRREGALLIDSERLGTCLIVTGGVVMRTAANDNREWSEANKQTWGAMLKAIWRLISPHDGVRLETTAMFHAIMVAVIDTTADRICSFLCDGDLLDDMSFLLSFVIFHTGQWMPRRMVRAELEAGRITQPLALPRIGAERHLRWADEFTSLAFDPRV